MQWIVGYVRVLLTSRRQQDVQKVRRGGQRDAWARQGRMYTKAATGQDVDQKRCSKKSKL
ncbi:unnamed protein product [Chondrus crispus]|uniref:Uncharacterized protein n=1 Tax=Chondrus crispus TaxID=2769 RepID=R7QK31_CHOCR|nr:unnamed protein product [Chondrus crispus]CDF38434.1 unnamed protein product [Chondrus crispus]|eukprot:XP_005718327.1 unnamed protein product [Chondrus crispus]